MDISYLFKSYILTTSYSSNATEIKNKIKKIRGYDKKSSTFLEKIKMITSNIIELYESIILKHSEFLASDKPNLSHKQFDSLTKNIINTNFQLLRKLRFETSKNYIDQQQNVEHKQTIISIIESHLKHVSEIYLKKKKYIAHKSYGIENLKLIEKSYLIGSKKNLERDHQYSQIINSSVCESPVNEDALISSDDIQMFEIENQHIFSDFNVHTDELELIESKVAQINELQEIFMEKVISQDKNLDSLLTTVVGSTQNVREANDQIRKAIQNNAGFRVWTLFFLLLMSFTLLFLDWYNP